MLAEFDQISANRSNSCNQHKICKWAALAEIYAAEEGKCTAFGNFKMCQAVFSSFDTNMYVHISAKPNNW